jgi:ribosomal protein L37AE/L43A
MEAMLCPRCRGRAVGRVGLAQWYCWDCCVEFARTAHGSEVYAMDEEGELVRLADASGSGEEVGLCGGSVEAS